MFLKLYGIALAFALAFDALWLGVIAKSFYAKQFGTLMAPQFNWVAAGLVYVVMIAGLVWFALLPAVAEHSWSQAVLWGAAFGFVVYATYDFTNLATLNHWPLLLTVVDIAWGTVLGAMVSGVTYWIWTH